MKKPRMTEAQRKELARLLTEKPQDTSWLPEKFRRLPPGKPLAKIPVDGGQLKITHQHFVFRDTVGKETTYAPNKAWPEGKKVAGFVMAALTHDTRLLGHPVVVDWVLRRQYLCFAGLLNLLVTPAQAAGGAQELKLLSKTLTDAPLMRSKDRADLIRAVKHAKTLSLVDPLFRVWWKHRRDTKTIRRKAVEAAFETHPNRENLSTEWLKQWLKEFETPRDFSRRWDHTLANHIHWRVVEQSGKQFSTLHSQVSRGRRILRKLSGMTDPDIWPDELRRFA